MTPAANLFAASLSLGCGPDPVADLPVLCKDSSCGNEHDYGLNRSKLLIRYSLFPGNPREHLHSGIAPDGHCRSHLDHESSLGIYDSIVEDRIAKIGITLIHLLWHHGLLLRGEYRRIAPRFIPG